MSRNLNRFILVCTMLCINPLWTMAQVGDSTVTSAPQDTVVVEPIIMDKGQMKTAFVPIWQGSYKHFENQIVGDLHVRGESEFYFTRAALPQAKGSVIQKVNEDDGFNLRYTAIYACGTSIENAQSVQEQWLTVLDEIMPDGFPRTLIYRSQFYKSLNFFYQYDTSDFTKQARKSTVSLGIKLVGDQYIVELIVAEPVFN